MSENIVENAFDTELSDNEIKSLVRPNDLFIQELKAGSSYVLSASVERVEYGNNQVLLKFLYQNTADLSLITFTHFDLINFNWDGQSLLDLSVEEKRNIAPGFTVVKSIPRTRKTNGDVIYPMSQRSGFDTYREQIANLDLSTALGRASRAKFRKALFKTDLIEGAKPLTTISIKQSIFAVPE